MWCMHNIFSVKSNPIQDNRIGFLDYEVLGERAINRRLLETFLQLFVSTLQRGGYMGIHYRAFYYRLTMSKTHNCV